MTNEAIKVLLMVMLLGGLRAAIFTTEEMPKWQPLLAQYRQAFLEWMNVVSSAISPRQMPRYWTALLLVAR
jgi:hypothetical protein